MWYRLEHCLSSVWSALCKPTIVAYFFDVLLTVHLSVFILVINQLYAQKFVLQ